MCEQYDRDLTALQAVEKAAVAHPALLRFVEKIAALKHEGEAGDDWPFEFTSEGSIATLNELVLKARQLLGTADKCEQCGQPVPCVIGWPGGSEVCQECFDAGQH